MFAVAAARAGWRCRHVVGAADTDAVDSIAAETGAEPTDRESVVARADVDVALVTDGDARTADDVARLLHRGVHVAVAPDALAAGDARRLAATTAPARLTVAVPFATAPVVQEWFRSLDGIGTVDHLSGRTDPGRTPGAADPSPHLQPSLLAVALLSARVARWGPGRWVECRSRQGGAGDRSRTIDVRHPRGRSELVVDEPASDPAPRPARWELQAASPDHALRVEVLPEPALERDGATAVPTTRGSHPADALGFTPFLRTLWADVTAGRRPVLDVDFARDLAELRAAAARSAAHEGRRERLTGE